MFTKLFYKNRDPYISKTRCYKIEAEFDKQDKDTYLMTVTSSDIPEAEGPTAVKNMTINFTSLSVNDFCRKYGKPIKAHVEPVEYWENPSNTSETPLLTNGSFTISTAHHFKWVAQSNFFTTVKRFILYIECAQ